MAQRSAEANFGQTAFIDPEAKLAASLDKFIDNLLIISQAWNVGVKKLIARLHLITILYFL